MSSSVSASGSRYRHTLLPGPGRSCRPRAGEPRRVRPYHCSWGRCSSRWSRHGVRWTCHAWNGGSAASCAALSWAALLPSASMTQDCAFFTGIEEYWVPGGTGSARRSSTPDSRRSHRRSAERGRSHQAQNRVDVIEEGVNHHAGLPGALPRVPLTAEGNPPSRPATTPASRRMRSAGGHSGHRRRRRGPRLARWLRALGEMRQGVDDLCSVGRPDRVRPACREHWSPVELP